MCDFYYGPEHDAQVAPEKPGKGWRVGYTGKRYTGEKEDGLEGPFRSRGYSGADGWLWAEWHASDLLPDSLRAGFHGFCVFKTRDSASAYKRDLVRSGLVQRGKWSIVRVEYCGHVKKADVHTRMGDLTVILAQRIRLARKGVRK